MSCCFLSAVNIVIPPFFYNPQSIEVVGEASIQALVKVLM
jgi:hypothetical protein